VLLSCRVNEQVFGLVVAQVQDDSTSEHWKQCVLLKLVCHDRHITETLASNSETLLRVSNGMKNSLFAGGDRHGRNAESATQESIGDLEEASRCFGDIADKLSLLVHIIECVEHGSAGNLYMIERQPSIIDSVHGHLHAHILDHDSLGRFHVIISDPDDEAVDSFILASDNGLGKHNSVVGVTGTVRDPELLRERRG